MKAKLTVVEKSVSSSVVSEKKDRTMIWVLVSILGLAMFVISAILNISTLSMIGLMITFMPLTVFQFNLFANRVEGLSLELKDLKTFWFCLFNISFFLVDSFLLFSGQVLFTADPSNFFSAIMAGENVSAFWPEFLALYVSINASGLIYRFIHKPKKMTVIYCI